MRAARFEQRLGFAIEPRTAELIDNALPMLSRVTGERIRHELYLILREREPERALCRLDGLNVLTEIHSNLSCGDSTWERFVELRQVLAGGQWDIGLESNGRPAPGLYLALLTYELSRSELESLAGYLKIFRSDLTLLRQVLDLRDLEPNLTQPELSRRECYALLRYSSTKARLIHWLSTDSECVRQRLWCYETELRHVQPVVDGDYLKSLGLKPSPLFSRLLSAVRDARLDGEIQTAEEEKALIHRLLVERSGAQA
jgi:tRNA nucleotidyltransferase (CCA-adding enzyme)